MPAKSKYTRWDVKKKGGKRRRDIKPVVNKVIQSRAEKKFFDLQTTVVPPNTGATLNLSDIPQGDGISDRDGQKVTAYYLGVKVVALQRGATVTSISRAVVVQDRRAVPATAPVWGDVYDIDGGSLNGNGGVLSYLEPSNLGRYNILGDKKVYHDDNSQNKRMIEFKIPFKRGLPMRWQGTGGTGWLSNPLFLLLIHSGTGAAGDDTQFDIFSRLRYTDT